MSHIHVCLISEQTIPNILAIDHFRPDEILFITTEKMQRLRKVEAILNTIKRLGIDIPYSEIIVQEDSIFDCHRKISKWIEDHEDSTFTVNLTCGTKIMSIATYECFKDYGSKMIYIPIPKNEFFEVYPFKKHSTVQQLTLRLNVVEYLTAYGLKVVNEKNLDKYKQEAKARMNITDFIVRNYKYLESALEQFYITLSSQRNAKSFNLNTQLTYTNPQVKKFLELFGFDVYTNSISKKLSHSEIKYLTGGWLEEYVFNCLDSLNHKGINDVVLSIEIENLQGNKNEFDVMFTKDNALYFVECKSLSPEDNITQSSLYKIGALQKEFGLRVHSFFVTTSPHILKDGKIRQSIIARAEQFKTHIIKPDEIENLNMIIENKLQG